MELRKFVWVGRNKMFTKTIYITVSEPMTTRDVLAGNYPSFFSLNNRAPGGNCEFLMEIFEGDRLLMHTENSMSDMKVILKDGRFHGEGPFNTHPLETYFTANDFVSMEFYTG